MKIDINLSDGNYFFMILSCIFKWFSKFGNTDDDQHIIIGNLSGSQKQLVRLAVTIGAVPSNDVDHPFELQ